MPKERNYNPVQAQRKADKAKAIKKGKSELQARRNEKLAKRNPDRIQKQIDDLKVIASSGGKLSQHETSVLAGLERELAAVNKARSALGDKAPTFSSYSSSRLGKRRRGEDEDTSDDDVPEDVRNIPMPRDTPPPISKEVMDAWHAKRRERWRANNPEAAREQDEARHRQQEQKVEKDKVMKEAQAKTVYESKPIVRDLRKEAVTAFVPQTVRMKMDKGKGTGGGLLEPEEADRLEAEGYLKLGASGEGGPKGVTMEEVDDEED